jgi:aminopeptidase
MTDPRIERLAKLIVNYSVDVKKGKEILISAPLEAEPLALEMLREVLKAGGHPIMLPYFDRSEEVFFSEAREHQLKYKSPYKRFYYENLDGIIMIIADSNTRQLSSVPGEKIATTSAASTEIRKIFMERSASKELKWCGLVYPTNAMAQEASMSLTEYEDFVYSAVMADRRDPISEWKKVKRRQQGMVYRLDKVNRLEFHGLDTELKMSVKGRKWVNCCGDRNMPDGEVFSAPVENSVNGTIRFTYPGIYMGKEVEDISLKFSKGKIVKASAAKGEDLLKNLIAIDDGAKRLGEVAIGTNHNIKKFTKRILFDEKLGGTIHMAIGSCFPETKGKNLSAIHWDMIKDMKKDAEIIADGDTVYKNGKWLG